MTATLYSMPSSYPHLAEALGRPIGRLVAALADRAEVDDYAPPYRSFDDILEESRICLEKTLEQDTVAALRRFGEMMECTAAHDRASSAGMLEQLEEIDHTLAAYVAACRAILQRPFPEQGEPGRILLAAILERPIRDVLGLLEKIRQAILDPAAAERTYGTTSITMSLTLEVDREIGAFMTWYELMARRRPRRFPLGPVVAGFLMGRATGGE